MSDQFPINYELAELVGQARAVPTPKVNVTAADVEAELRAGRSWAPWAVAGLAAAAAIVLGFGLWGGEGAGKNDASTVVAAAVTANDGVGGPSMHPVDNVEALPRPADDDVESSTPADRVVAKPTPAAAPANAAGLGDGVTVATISGAAPQVSSKWDVTVAAGVYRIDVAPTASTSLRVHTGQRVLNVEPGARVLLRDGTSTVEAGRATWADLKAKVPPAADLATQAEIAMARGDNKSAIKALTRLARSYPRATETRTGLVDLARLRTATGDSDRARCAYQLVLQRWPSASTNPDVERALARLGDGPQCRGLAPKR